ncbi:MAG: ABC-2 family transporter protein [Candidatus Micrarchaeota archaeon]|nr:ABC-2 family transporter protein [Candidatus Micrarchaeota archaeon]
MQLDLSRYIAHFRVTQKSLYAYKVDMSLSVLFTVLGFAVMIAVWTAIYAATGSTQIKGLSLPAIYAYFIVIGGLNFIVGTNIDDQMMNSINDGSIGTAMLKPIKYPIQLVLGTIADSFSLFSVPAVLFFIAALFIAHAGLGLWQAAAFLVEVVMAFCIINLFGFLVGLAAIYLTNIYGLVSIVFTLISILGGMVAPLTFYPQWAQNILYLSPLPSMFYFPASTFLGTISNSMILQSLAVGFVWIAILLGVSVLGWKKMSIKVALAGG